MRSLLVNAIFLVLVASCSASVTRVEADGSGDYPTIQAAISMAYNDVTIILGRGVYTGYGNRDLELWGKRITITSANPEDPDCVENTIIDCEGTAPNPHRAFYVRRGEETSTIIKGITITGGYHTEGGAIRCENSSISLIGCILRNNVAHNGGAIFGYSSMSEISNCVMRDNYAIQSGGAMRFDFASDRPVKVDNCLIFSNTAGRDGGAITSYHSSDLSISNSTISDNQVLGVYPSPAQIGSGGGVYCSNGSSVSIDNSIIVSNTAEAGNQITSGVGFESIDIPPNMVSISYSDIEGGSSEPNLLIEEGCEVEIGDGVIYGDPLFVSGPFGDYYLSQTIAGQLSQSPCVDTGSYNADAFDLDKYTTRTDVWFDVYDKDLLDMGYHYPMDTPVVDCKYCDVLLDGVIDIGDISIIAINWLGECIEPQDCDWADINLDSVVNYFDLSMVAKCFYVADDLPPDPATATWDIKPQLLEPYQDAIEMSSQVSYDKWFGSNVEYNFKCTLHSNHDSGWQQNYDISNLETYTENPHYYLDSGLDFETAHGYLLQVRDPRGNRTTDSSVIYVMTGNETDPPQPDPSQWEQAPYNTGESIEMIAREAADDNEPVEYFFRYTGTGDGHSSEWQKSNVYVDTGLTEGEYYSYSVKARDAYENETEESVVEGAIFDTTPPTPSPSLWQSEPNNTGTSIIMTATEASDTNDPVKYYFRYTNQAGGEPNNPGDGHDSGWQPSNIYEDSGMTEGEYHYYCVRAKDALGNETQESVVRGAMLDGTPPSPDKSTWESVPSNTGTSIRMVATEAIDASGSVKYYFRYTDESGEFNGSGDGHDSGWQKSTTYEDTGLTDGELYHYTVKTKDEHGNVSQESDVEWAELDSSVLDKTPPVPNPSRWNEIPVNTGASIRMEVMEASDASGFVEYYFRYTDSSGISSGTGDGHSSEWQRERVYQDTGLTQDRVYHYRVKARDANGNETDESVIRSAIFDASILDEDPPTPNPSQWKTVPNNTGHAIEMEAKFTTDEFGSVQYYFRCTDSDGIASNASYGGSHSGWQKSEFYADSGLENDSTYYYRVKARDKNGNETDESSVMSAKFDDSLLDKNAPPDPIWDIKPVSKLRNGKWYHHMKVHTVTDPEHNGVEYFFWCDQEWVPTAWRNSETNNVDYNGNPIGPNEYWVFVGSQYMSYSYQVYVRDQSVNQNQDPDGGSSVEMAHN